jgi:hypothetical protein
MPLSRTIRQQLAHPITAAQPQPAIVIEEKDQKICFDEI